MMIHKTRNMSTGKCTVKQLKLYYLQVYIFPVILLAFPSFPVFLTLVVCFVPSHFLPPYVFIFFPIFSSNNTFPLNVLYHYFILPLSTSFILQFSCFLIDLFKNYIKDQIKQNSAVIQNWKYYIKTASLKEIFYINMCCNLTSKSGNWAFCLAEEGRDLEVGKVLWLFSSVGICLCSSSSEVGKGK